MRHFIFLLLFSVGSCSAQTASSQPIDVPSVGVVYLVDPATQVLKPLPVEPWTVGHTSAVKAAYGRGHNATISIDMSGERSSFRIATGNPEFVFNFGSPENATLYVSTDNKKERRFALETVNVRDNSIANLPGIPIEVTQLGASSYKLVPKSPLQHGEYTITLKATNEANGSTQGKGRKPFQYFTFGID